MTTIIDLAGGTIGGAGRFREQFTAHSDPSTAIGWQEHLTPDWMVLRERLARGADRVVAANNASFAWAGTERWVMARNANHFLDDQEMARSRQSLGLGFRAQIPVIRGLLHRATTIVAPTSSMADRIARTVPSVSDRVVVRFHPLTPGAPARRDQDTIFVPVSPAPFKRMDERMEALRRALEALGSDTRVQATLPAREAPEAVARDPRFDYLGRVERAAIDDAYTHVRAIYYPTDVESFGYPLAEARANGLPIVAIDNDHNREVAGPALCGFTEGDVDSLAAAVERALSTTLEPDAAPFDPADYFRWLIG